MLLHGQIWSAIDAIAANYGLTSSGLAKKAGMDATTFNKSKRVSVDGRLRWPSTESVAKVLDATGASLDEFMALVSKGAGARDGRRIPLLGIAEAGSGHFDDRGGPKGASWDEVNFPDLPGNDAYALEVSGDSMRPLFRDGDILICSPSASIRRGDRVVVRTSAGEVILKELRRRTARFVELVSLNPAHPDRIIPAQDVASIARVVWASQ